MGLRLEHSVVGHFHNFCTILSPAYLIGRANCRTKVIRLGLCLNHFMLAKAVHVVDLKKTVIDG